MNDRDKLTFIKLWTAAWANYGQKIDPLGAGLAFSVLSSKGFTFDQIKAGIALYCTNPRNSYGPSASALIAELEGDPENAAMLVWPEVERLIHGGVHNRVIFDDPIIHQVIQDMGGFKTLGMIPTIDMKWTKKEFIAQYVSIKQSGRSNFPASLRLAISLTRHPDFQIMYIGDKEKCLMIEQQGEVDGQLALASEIRGLITSA